MDEESANKMNEKSERLMDLKELEELLDKIGNTTNHEIPTPILSEADLITEHVVQKLRIFNYQRRVRTVRMGTELYRPPLYKNIIVTNELAALKKRLAISVGKLNELREFKLQLVDDYKRKAEDLISNIFEVQTTMRTWNELEEHQVAFMKLAIIETKMAQDRCEDLIPKVKLANKVKKSALNFYKKHYLYLHCLNRNSTSSENNGTMDFMKFIESTVMSKDALWKDLQKEITHYQDVNLELAQLTQDYSKWQDLTNECVKYHNRILKQEHKCETYKRILYKMQKITESLKNEKTSILLAFDNLLNCVFEYFPAKLFADMDKNTFLGKVQCLKQAYAFCKLIKA